MLIGIKYEGRNQLLDRYPMIERCFKCGTCSLVCPVQYLEEYTPTQSYVYDLITCENPFTNSNLWSCAACHKCHEICPQDVNPAKVFTNLKELSFEKGLAPQGIKSLVKTVITTGISFPITSTTQRLREKLNLPPFEFKAQTEIQIIAKRTGLKEKITNMG